jgi:hypothetical protein
MELNNSDFHSLKFTYIESKYIQVERSFYLITGF